MSQATPEQEAWGGGEHYQFGSERGVLGQQQPRHSLMRRLALSPMALGDAVLMYKGRCVVDTAKYQRRKL